MRGREREIAETPEANRTSRSRKYGKNHRIDWEKVKKKGKR